MPVLILHQILDILRSGQLDQLVGAIEDEIMDAKSEPYQLDNPRHKLELAKDVAAFANARGGVILIGARTERSPVHLGDEITQIRLLGQGLVDPERYHAVLCDWIYPKPEGISITWHPHADRADKGVVAIVIPAQPVERQPYLVTHTPDNDTGRRVDIVFGYTERRRAGVDPVGVRDLQVLLRDGRRSDEVRTRLDSMAEELTQLRDAVRLQQSQGLPALEPAATAEEINERRIELAAAADLKGRPLFALTATPTPRVEFRDFLRENSLLVKALDDPPIIRSGGFDLRVGARARLLQGRLRRAVKSGVGGLELGREGTLLFVTEGDGFLCYGTRVPNGPLRINPLVLSEVTYGFVELSRLVLSQAPQRLAAVDFTIALDNMTAGGQPSQLFPGPVGTRAAQFGMDLHDAPGAQIGFQLHWDTPGIHPGRAAFLLVREVYGWFEIDEDGIPYTAVVGGERVIDPEVIRSHP